MFKFLKKLFAGNTDALKAAIASGARVIDVRSASEFASGHVPGSINIPLNQIPEKAATIMKSSTPVIFCCASGMRSGQATSILRNKGMQEVHNGGSWYRVNNLLNA